MEAAFSHKRGFGKAMLRDMSEGALERLTKQLVAWSRDIQWPDQAGDGLWRAEANTAEECVEKTGLFMQDQHWPFTKIIRVYLSSQVLKTGVVLADLPGKGNTAPHYLWDTSCYFLFRGALPIGSTLTLYQACRTRISPGCAQHTITC